MNKSEEVNYSLSQYEAAVTALDAFRNQHDTVFEKEGQLKADVEELFKEIQLHAFSAAGPPEWMETVGEKGRGGIFNGARFRVRAVYSKMGDTFDPKKLPKAILAAPGVVKTVDTRAVEKAAAASADPAAIEKARQEGKWKRPSVYVELVGAPIPKRPCGVEEGEG